MFNKSEKKSLKICVTEKESLLIFDFEDNGVGISKENQEKIFSPLTKFYSDEIEVDDTNDIGLAYAKGIIERHDGRIFVLKSEIGEGSVIRIEIEI